MDSFDTLSVAWSPWQECHPQLAYRPIDRVEVDNIKTINSSTYHHHDIRYLESPVDSTTSSEPSIRDLFNPGRGYSLGYQIPVITPMRAADQASESISNNLKCFQSSPAIKTEPVSTPQGPVTPSPRRAKFTSERSDRPIAGSRRVNKRRMDRNATGRDDDTDEENEDEEPPRKRANVPSDAEEDPFNENSMSCPFRYSHPAIYSSENDCSTCMTIHNNISTIVRHMQRNHSVEREGQSSGISTFHLPAALTRHPPAGLCKNCWSSFDDAGIFETHMQSLCVKASRSKREKYRLLVSTFTAVLLPDADQADAAIERDLSMEDDDDDDDADEAGDVDADKENARVATRTAATTLRKAAVNQSNDAVTRREHLALVERVSNLEQMMRTHLPLSDSRGLQQRGGLSSGRGRGIARQPYAASPRAASSYMMPDLGTLRTTGVTGDEENEQEFKLEVPTSTGFQFAEASSYPALAATTSRQPLRRSPIEHHNRRPSPPDQPVSSGVETDKQLLAAVAGFRASGPAVFPSSRLPNYTGAAQPFAQAQLNPQVQQQQQQQRQQQGTSAAVAGYWGGFSGEFLGDLGLDPESGYMQQRRPGEGDAGPSGGDGRAGGS